MDSDSPLTKNQEYYQKHKERISTYFKDYYQKNRDKILKRTTMQVKEYVKEHIDHCKAYKREYYILNAERIRNRRMQYYFEKKERTRPPALVGSRRDVVVTFD